MAASRSQANAVVRLNYGLVEMSETISKEHLRSLLVGYLGIAKSDMEAGKLDDAAFERITQALPAYLYAVVEAVALDSLVDKRLIRHAIASLAADNTNEETVMCTFMFYIYKLVSQGSRHPLEMGIVRQKVNGVLPILENAMNSGLIRAEVFESNASLLMSIADQREDMGEAMAILESGYIKYDDKADG